MPSKRATGTIKKRTATSKSSRAFKKPKILMGTGGKSKGAVPKPKSPPASLLAKQKRNPLPKKARARKGLRKK